MAVRASLTSDRSSWRSNLDDLLKRSCPRCCHQPRRFYPEPHKSDTITTLPGACPENYEAALEKLRLRFLQIRVSSTPSILTRATLDDQFNWNSTDLSGGSSIGNGRGPSLSWKSIRWTA